MESAHLDTAVAPSHPKKTGKIGTYSVAILLASLVIVLSAAAFRGKAEDGRDVQAILRNLTTCCSADDFSGLDREQALRDIRVMLRRPEDQPHYFKAIRALGILGRDKATENSLWMFLVSPYHFEVCQRRPEVLAVGAKVSAERAPEDISDGLVQAKIEVPLAIASFVSRSPDTSDSFKILEAGTNPAFWEGRLRWSAAPVFANTLERNTMLATQCVKALTLAGQPNAVKEILTRLQNNPPSTDVVYLDSIRAANRRYTARQ